MDIVQSIPTVHFTVSSAWSFMFSPAPPLVVPAKSKQISFLVLFMYLVSVHLMMLSVTGSVVMTLFLYLNILYFSDNSYFIDRFD
jgi:hypothetical protein